MNASPASKHPQQYLCASCGIPALWLGGVKRVCNCPEGTAVIANLQATVTGRAAVNGEK